MEDKKEEKIKQIMTVAEEIQRKNGLLSQAAALLSQACQEQTNVRLMGLHGLISDMSGMESGNDEESKGDEK